MVSTKAMLSLTITAIIVETIVGAIYLSLPLGSDGSR